MTAGPQLLPGACVLRRDARTLQIGTSPGIVVRDRPGLAALLRRLDGTWTPALLAELISRDLPQFDGDPASTIAHLTALGVVLPGQPSTPGLTVGVRHDAGSIGLADLLTSALGPPTGTPELEVVVTTGEPRRSSIRDLWMAGVRHLPVMIDDKGVRIGPLVVPGVTPCLACLDAHLTAVDPGWAALVPQFGSSHVVPRDVGPRLRLRAAAEVMHQVECIEAGVAPPASAAVLLLGADHDVVQRRTVPFAADCGCGILAA